MGCHTWFRNSINDMPDEHLEKLRKVHIRGIKNAYIYKCSLEKWLSGMEDDLKNLNESYAEEESGNELYKMEFDMISKMNSKEYYETHRTQYVKDLETLQNPDSTKKELLKVFKRHDLSFELNSHATKGSYEMSNVGWYDQYRVSSYPGVVHHNADEAIKWLEEFDNGKNITCNGKKGMSDEVRGIIRDFFKQFPNGTIHYG